VFLLRAVMLAAFVTACWKLRLAPVGFLTVLSSKAVLNSVLLGNVEGLVVLGGFAPAGVAVVAASLKPQVGALLLAARLRGWWQGGRRPGRGFLLGVGLTAAAALATAPLAWWQGVAGRSRSRGMWRCGRGGFPWAWRSGAAACRGRCWQGRCSRPTFRPVPGAAP